MKKIYYLIFALLLQQAQAQNLVSNPSFENLVGCDTGTIRIFWKNLAPNWKQIDTNAWLVVVNTCVNNLSSNYCCCKVPVNTCGLGYQYPRTGNGMIGIYTYLQRDYLQQMLHQKLLKNKKYLVGMWVNSENQHQYANNNIGIYLSDTLVVPNKQAPFKKGIIPQIMAYGNPIIMDTLGWQQVAGVYTAKGTEQYISIGNFFSDSLTLKKSIYNTTPPSTAVLDKQGGYFIDDVSVIPIDSIQLQADAGRDTTITKGDSAFIGSYTSGLDTLKWQVLVNGQVIDTIRPGFWVKPTTNTCYVLTQTVNGFTSSDTVCVYVNALPVRFIDLVLLPSPVGEGLGVRFSTANEINVSHYNIQYSTNGKDFKTTGNPIPAKGGSLNEYMVSNSPPLEGLGVVDGVVKNVVYYRIQATDHDGQQTFSEVKSIKLNAAGVVSIYPNPANNEVTVTGKHIQQISISDVAGKTLISTNNKKINISNLPNGIYFISIKTTNNYEVQKLVKW